jgi:hypothetical protein
MVFCQQLHWLTILDDNLSYRILETKQEEDSRFNHNIIHITTENNINSKNYSKNYSNATTLHASSDSKNTTSISSFLIYILPKLTGQGLGNIISGILAAHRLAEEFQRTICHMGSYSSFDQAFKWKDLDHIQKCEEVLLDVDSWENRRPNSFNTIVQYNYDETSVQSECNIKELLLNYQQYPILYYKGNTYPRWPTNTITLSDENDQMQTPSHKQNQPRDYFHEKFKPTTHLVDIIPWNIDNPPSIVVHLRDSDGKFDERAGLDNQTLSLLADELNNIASTSVDTDASHHKNKYSNSKNKNNNHIFLVTNRVEWYDKFPEWGHPNWSLVHHSALGRISWGRRRDNEILITDYSKSRSKEEEALQMWADWYTLLNAKRIYHTMSDFSRSASRWNEKIQSFTIVGSATTTAITNMTGKNNINTIITENSKLILRNDLQGFNESYAPRLVNRKKEDLRFCDPETEKKYLMEKKNKEFLDLMKALKRHREG